MSQKFLNHVSAQLTAGANDRPQVRIWSKINLHCRATSPLEGMRARPHDAPFMMGRQLQKGELTGHDGSDPAIAKIEARTIPVTGYNVNGESYSYDLQSSPPLEVLVEREPQTRLSWLRRCQIGRRFERALLHLENGASIRQACREIWPLLPLDRENHYATSEAARLASVAMQRRIVDGGAVVDAYRNGSDALADFQLRAADLDDDWMDPDIGTGGTLNPDVAAAIVQAGQGTYSWFLDTFSVPEESGPGPAWQDDRLEYQFGLTATEGECQVELEAREYYRGSIEWFDFSVKSETGLDCDPDSVTRKYFIPTQITYPGQPHDRFWQFEDAKVDLTSFSLDKTDLHKLLVGDFGMTHGNDWFMTPMDAPAGQLVQITTFEVTDTFGNKTSIPPSSRSPAGGNMFTLSNSAHQLFFIPPYLEGVRQSKPIESVVMLRDETSNLAWAIEEKLRGALGSAISGEELAENWRNRCLDQIRDELEAAAAVWIDARNRLRDARVNPNSYVISAERDARLAALFLRDQYRNAGGDLRDFDGRLPERRNGEQYSRYVLEDEIDGNRFPFVPERWDQEDQFGIRLRRYATPDYCDLQNGTGAVQAKGRFLRADIRPFYVQEEEVPSAGIRLVRTEQFARSAGGGRYFWIGRKKQPAEHLRSKPRRNDRVTDD